MMIVIDDDNDSWLQLFIITLIELVTDGDDCEWWDDS